jgi:hypothetical protein
MVDEEDHGTTSARLVRVSVQGGEAETWRTLSGYPYAIGVDDASVFVAVHALSGPHYSGQLLRFERHSESVCPGFVRRARRLVSVDATHALAS